MGDDAKMFEGWDVRRNIFFTEGYQEVPTPNTMYLLKTEERGAKRTVSV